ncbi:drug resistance transporter, EmrB/QacA subfamily [Fontibacillus panacisegetis]|uniref:Drug resistance transporter, EmrB/QacA subfamily n=1 Tax=Fontibacillus panacisegetis TaxID=670482 RepID=A0A1G7QRQ1_9BACL|nr:MFS transporter [Fontibacillus panacisegetis]SDG01163.1 drug resistance transporter, EmrB/QacA subfamily [Fontibacillus panacisegetis]
MNNKTRALVQYIICTGAFLSNLSAGMFNIALVDIARDYEVPIALAQWVVTAYLLVISVLLPIMGRLGDTFGRRTVHNIGYFSFALGALCCAFAPSLGWLIAFRVLQAIGASMYQATNMALIVSVFPPEKRGKALGLISTFVAAGSMVGPSLGGLLIQWFSWRTNFWLLAGIAAIAWVSAQRLIPKDKPEASRYIDVAGAALFAASLTGLVTAVNLGSLWGWQSPAVILLLLLFASSAAGFAAWCLSSRWNGEHTAGMRPAPFIELKLFIDAGMNTGILITVVTYMAAFSSQLVLPVFLRGEMGISPAMAGFIMMGYPLALIIVSPIFGSWSDRLGSVPLLATGLLMMGGVLAALGFLNPSYPLFLLIVLIVLLGVSMGMVTSPNNSLVMGRVESEHLGLISSLLALSRNLGMMFGTAAGGALLVGGTGGGVSASLVGFRAVFIICLTLVVFSLVLLLLTVRFTKQRYRHEETMSS